MSLLRGWLDWAFHLRYRRQPDPVVVAVADYQSLLACYRSEQMSAAQLQAHMEADPAFAAFVDARTNDGDVIQTSRDESPVERPRKGRHLRAVAQNIGASRGS